MDITALNAQFFTTNSSNPFSASGGFHSAGIGLPALPNRDDGFEDVLRRLQNSGAEKSESEAAASPAAGNVPVDKNSRLYELCLELETFLIKNLIKSMRSTVQKTNLINTGFAGEMYEDMLYDEYAKDFTRNANLGFAEMAYRELTGTR